MRSTRTRRRGTALAALGLALAAGVAGLGPSGAGASSHREAPLIAADPAVDNTDVYAFVSPDRPGYVTFVANWHPVRGAQRRPELLPVRHRRPLQHQHRQQRRRQGRTSPTAGRSRTSTSAAATRSCTTTARSPRSTTRTCCSARPTRCESSFNGAPFKTRGRRRPGRAVAGRRRRRCRTTQTLRDQAITTLPGGWKIFAGQADDPFFLDLRVFDLLYGGDLTEVGQDTLAGYNVNTIALQVPSRTWR